MDRTSAFRRHPITRPAILAWAMLWTLLLHADDTQPKYKQPDLPKEELAFLAFHPSNCVHVLAIDGVEYSPGKFFARGFNALNVYVLPGVHELVVRMDDTFFNGGGRYSMQTQTTTLQVDVKKGRRYVLSAWYFNNGAPLRFTASTQRERSETANSFAPGASAKFPWLQNVHFEISDTTDLPEEKYGVLKVPDLRGLTHEEWKWNNKEMKGSIPDTIADLEKQIAARPNDAWAHRQRATVELWTGKPDYERALAEATRVVELNPGWARAYQERAWIWLSKGNLDKEIEDLNKSIELAPQFTRALLMRGNAWQGKGDMARAIADLTRAIETDTCDAWSYHRRGEIWLQKGEYDKALADQNRAIAIAPKFAPAFAARAGVWAKKQDVDKAVADYTAAIDIDLKLVPAYLARAELLASKNELDRAIADYSRALRVDDKNGSAYVMRGAVHQKQGECDPAIADYTKALELDPSADQVRNWRGSCWTRKGDTDRAMADFTEALRSAPSDPWAYEAIATLYAQKRDGVQAADYCMKAGGLRVARKDFSNAVNDWSAAISADPKRAAAFQQRAETYAQLTQVDLAIADYTQALSIAPAETEWARRLEELKRAPRTAVPSQSAASAAPPVAATPPVPPAAIVRAAAAVAAIAEPKRDERKAVIQGTLLHYPDGTPMAGKGVILGFRRASGFFEPNYGPRAVTDSHGVFRLEVGDAMRGVLTPGDKTFSLLVFENWDSVEKNRTPIGAVAQKGKGRNRTTDWELPRGAEVLDLDRSGALFLNEGK